MRNGSRATVLVDTNVLVYRHDPRDRAKQDRALEVFRELVQARRAATSAQCLVEFCRVVTQRLPERMAPADALAEIGRHLEVLEVVDLTGPVALEACRGSSEHRLAIWDALVWAAAKLNGLPYVITEDAEHGRSLEGVTYLDPFDARFEVGALVS